MENDIIFRKVRFGGFNKTDVMNYIAKITDEFQGYKTETVKTVERLKTKADEMEEAYQKLKNEYETLKQKYEDKENAEKGNSKEDFSSATSEIKILVESLCDNMNNFLLSLPDEEAESDRETTDEETESISDEPFNEDPNILSQDEELRTLIDKYAE